MAEREVGQVPTTWGDKLREAAEWFDTVDRLLDHLVIESTNGETDRLLNAIGGGGTEIQDDLRRLASWFDAHDDGVRSAARLALLANGVPAYAVEGLLDFAQSKGRELKDIADGVPWKGTT